MIDVSLIGQLTTSSGFGHAGMIWTVRFAVLFYLVRVAVLLGKSERPGVPTLVECLCWAMGCGFYLAHLVLAFEVEHAWSHDAAWRHTASETERLTGVARGDGLWVNYAFTLFWVADVVRLAISHRQGRRTNRSLEWAIQIGFAFIVFNATVVFGPALYRWLAGPVALVLGGIVLRRSRVRALAEKDSSGG